MARKVFISVLGTTRYLPCQYSRDEEDFTSPSTKFIQRATLEYLFKKEQWTEDDKIFILMTEDAHTLNWDVEKRPISKFNPTIIEYSGLKKELDEMGIKAQIEPIKIDEGKDEKELWNIFETVYGLIKDGEEDRLFFDITHGFRYLSMLVIVLGNYAKFLNGDKVESITYGNYEANDTPIKPLMDLIPISTLQDWTFAAANFTENGDVARLVKLGNEKLKPLLRDSKGKDIAASEMRNFLSNLESFIDEVKLCRGVAIHDGVSFKNLMNADKSDDRIPPLKPVIANIVESISKFKDESDSRNQLEAARWCYHKKQYQPAITELLEGIVTFFCCRYRIHISNKACRDAVYDAFTKRHIELWNNIVKEEIKTNGFSKKKPMTYFPSYGVDENIVNKIVADKYLESEELVNFFVNLRDNIRNDINHGGMRKSPKTVKNIKSAIKDIDEIVDILSQDLPFEEFDTVSKPRLLVNLSNHPSNLWPAEQRAAAAAYGERIEDIPFPAVDPLADEDYIKEQAEICVRNVLELARNNTVTVHIMGELCLTYNIIHELQAHGIRCIASTTERIAWTLPDGSKRTEFHFKRFREYGK